jgi:multidrug efflux system membrane fusion protein
VYAVKPDNTVTVRRVRAGATEGDWTSVQGDLAVGDNVVTDGADRLREGAQVEVIVPQKPGGPGNGGPAKPDASAAGKPSAATPVVNGAPAQPATAASVPMAPAQAAPAKPATVQPVAPLGVQGGPPAAGVPPTLPPSGASGSPDAPAGGPPRADGLPPWFDRLSPEVQEKFKAMNAEERKVFIEQMRERRRQREAQGG